MKFLHLLSRLTGTPWLITAEALENITLLIESRLTTPAAFGPAPEPTPRATPAARPGIAVIPIHGVIGKRLSPMEMACGGCDLDALEASFDAAVADPAISKIQFHIDSPGGAVPGVPELAQKIADTKLPGKTIEAITEGTIGSAAYWLASACDEIIATPTSQIGSIGAVLQVRETIDTKAADGRTRLRVFRSGEDKFAGADGPLTPKQEAAAQSRVDQIGAMFRAHVTAQRTQVKPETMTGQVYLGDEALKRGLVDRIVPRLSALV